MMKLLAGACIGVWVAVAWSVAAPVVQAQSRTGIVTVRLETVTGQPLAAVNCSVVSFGWGVPRGGGQVTIAEGQTDARGQIAFDVSRWPRASYELDFRVAGRFGHGVMLDVDGQSHTLVFAYDPDTNTLTEETINGIALPPPPADKNGDGGAANRVPPADPARMTAYVPTYAAYLTQGAPTTTPKPAIPPTASFTLAAPQAALTLTSHTRPECDQPASRYPRRAPDLRGVHGVIGGDHPCDPTRATNAMAQRASVLNHATAPDGAKPPRTATASDPRNPTRSV